MEITPEQNNIKQNEYDKPINQLPKDVLQQKKSLTELNQGDKFKATVIDIKPNQVTIKLSNGETMTAKSLILPEARMGEDTIFLVKENYKGQILLEMLKPEGNVGQNNIAKEALINVSMHPTMENLALVRNLMNNNLPIDAETLKKASYFNYSNENMTLEKVMFLLKEEFPANEQTIKSLLNITDKNFKLENSLNNIETNILKMEDSALKQSIIKTILKNLSNNMEQIINETEINEPDTIQILNKFKEIFSLNINSPNDKISEYFKNIYQVASDIKDLLETSNVKSDIYKDVQNIKENIEFMNHINNYKEYMQIPFNIGNFEQQAELHIFKDNKGKKNYNEHASVLLGLDYNSLGRVEVFINKSNNNLNFQFKSKNDKINQMINKNFQKLSNILKEKGFLISGLSFKKLEEPFQVTEYLKDEIKKENTTTKRYSFDMHV